MPETKDLKMQMSADDHELIMHYLSHHPSLRNNPVNAALYTRMEEAELVEDSSFPWEIVKLNTKVIIRDKLARLNYTYIVVMPEEADHRKCKVSLFSPIGSALFGKRRGEDIYWNTGKGKRYFTIMAMSQLGKAREKS